MIIDALAEPFGTVDKDALEFNGSVETRLGMEFTGRDITIHFSNVQVGDTSTFLALKINLDLQLKDELISILSEL